MSMQTEYLGFRAQGLGVRKSARKAGYAHGVPPARARAIDALRLKLEQEDSAQAKIAGAKAQAVALGRKIQELTDLRAGYIMLAQAGAALGGLA